MIRGIHSLVRILKVGGKFGLLFHCDMNVCSGEVYFDDVCAFVRGQSFCVRCEERERGDG